MPGFNLNPGEAKSIAAYLIGRDNKPPKSLELPKLPPIDELRDALLDGGELTAKESLVLPDEKVRQRLVSFGRRVMQQKNCAACHEFVPAGERAPLAATRAQHSFTEIAFRPSGGCLAESNGHYDGKVPQFGKSFDRSAAVEFLKVAATAPGTSAPGEEARLTLERFNCLGCHERDGQGGLAPDVIKRLAENQTPEAAELVRPPQLTGVTGKLLAGYINAVLLDGRRSRPWMTLRMPQFPKEAIASLPAGLAALDAEPLHNMPDASSIPPPTEDDVLSEAGLCARRLKGLWLHEMPRHARRPQPRHAGARSRADDRASEVRVVRSLDGRSAANSARHADANGVLKRQESVPGHSGRRSRQAAAGDLAVSGELQEPAAAR